MPTLNPEAQAIIAALEDKPGVAPDQIQNLCVSLKAAAAKDHGGGMGKFMWCVKAEEPYLFFRRSLSFHASAR